MMLNLPKKFSANTNKYSEASEDLPSDSPKYSSPFASLVAIHQNFNPPKFSHILYYYCICVCETGLLAYYYISYLVGVLCASMHFVLKQ